jgi:hypothetical protein
MTGSVPPGVGEAVDSSGSRDQADRFRYPGSAPFGDTDVDRLLFHGRQREVDTVLHSILSFDLFLLYSPSGMGKTSLLNAGVLQHLRERNLWPVTLRLNDPSTPVVELIEEQILGASATSPDITVGRNPYLLGVDSAHASLWDVLSGLEVWKGNTLQQPVLIFDQFEELFTLGWDDDDRTRFIASFGEVVRRHRISPTEHPNDSARLPPPNVKIVVVVREDSLGELERLAVDVPQIMQNRFRLEGLNPTQAEAAICEPARMDDDRLAKPFTYSPDAANAIIDFLRSKQENGRTVVTRFVEPSQLQIVCEHVERSILPQKVTAKDLQAAVVIAEGDLGGKAGLDRILRDFYRNKLQLFPPRVRRKVRALCETGLISQQRRRLSVEEGEIKNRFGVERARLDELIAYRLVRAEPRVGSVYYELAHDTLVTPILAFREAVRKARRRRWLVALLGVAALVGLVVSMPLLADEDRQLLDVGGPMASGVIADSDRDRVGFELAGSGDEMLAVTVLAGGGLEPVLEVRDPAGRLEVQTGPENGAATVVVRGDVTGRYEVVVHGAGSSSGSFDLSVTPADVVDVTVGDVVNGRISRLGAVNVFAVAGGDETVVVEVSPARTLDAALRFRTPDNAAAQLDEEGPGHREVVLVGGELVGQHVIVVSGGGSSWGSFQLVVRPAAAIAVGVGDIVPDKIAYPGDTVVYDVATTGAAPLVIEVVPDTGLDVALEVTGAAGTPAVVNEGTTGDTETATATSGAAGHYRVIVRGFRSSTGDFELYVRVPPERQMLDFTVTVEWDADGGHYSALVDTSGVDDAAEIRFVDGNDLTTEIRQELTLANDERGMVFEGSSPRLAATGDPADFDAYSFRLHEGLDGLWTIDAACRDGACYPAFTTS